MKLRFNHNAGFWATAYVYLVTMAFSTVPAPLYLLYQERDGFNTLMITVIFAGYAIGAMVSLFFVGHVSDWVGRRRILLAAIGLNIVSAGIFLVGSGLWELIVARVMSGIAVGMVTGTATAYLAELHSIARPDTPRTRTDLVASAAPMIGLGSGALIAGWLAAYVSQPLLVPYYVFVGLLVVAFIGVCLTPETVTHATDRAVYRVRRIALPAQARGRFLAASGTALASFAMLAVFSSVSPAFMAGTLGYTSRALAGTVTFLVYVAGALAPLFLLRMRLRQLLVTGFALMLGGLLALIVGVWLANFGLFLVAGVVVGAGCGILFKGCVSTVIELASPQHRSETMAGLFLTAYIGLSIPIIGLGAAALYVSMKMALLVFALLFFGLVVLTRRRLLGPIR